MTSLTGEVLDLSRPHRELDEGSDPDFEGADFIEQDGRIFAWSDSNVQYELAWWLEEGVRESTLSRHLRATRCPPNFVPPEFAKP